MRLFGVLFALVALLAGTLWGEDDHFPFGPFRMYSIANDPDGEIRVVTFSATTESGRRIELRPEVFGLRPAEVEGQMEHLVEEPNALAGLVVAYERLGRGPDLESLRLVEEAHRLENGTPVDVERRVLVTWSRS